MKKRHRRAFLRKKGVAARGTRRRGSRGYVFYGLRVAACASYRHEEGV